MAAGRSQGADTAWTTHDDDDDDHDGGGRCRRDDDCDDDNPCTKDKCHRKSGKRRGKCVFKPRDTRHGRPIVCDDGNACTQSDSCQAGVARAPTPSPARPATSATSPGRATRQRVPARTPRRRTGRRATTPTRARGATRASWATARVRTRWSAWPAISATRRGRATRRRAPARTPRRRTVPRAPTPTRAPDRTRVTPACAACSGDPITLIAFVSGRDDIVGNPLLTAEIYLMNPDGTSPVRVTNNV